MAPTVTGAVGPGEAARPAADALDPIARDDPAQSRRRTVLDPLAGLVAVVSLVVYQVHGHHGPLSRDLSVYVYAGQRVFDGAPPYVDVLNRAGPLAHLVPALGVGLARFLGIGDVIGTRLVFMVIAAAAVVATYVLCRSLFRSRSAGLVGAATMLCFHGFIHYASNGPREKTLMVLFLVLFLLALHRGRWLAAGVWLSLATLTLQIAFPVGVGAVVVGAIAVRRGARLRSLARLVLGGLLPLVGFVIYFAAVGALTEAIRSFVLINARYTQADPVARFAARDWRSMSGGYGVTIWVLALGLLVLFSMGAVGLCLATRPRPQPAGSSGADPDRVRVSRVLAPTAGAALVGVLWSLRDFDGWPDAFPLLPLAAVGVAALIPLLRRVSVRVSLVVTVVATLLAVADAGVYAVTTRTNQLDVQRAAAAAVERHLPPSATYFSYNAPEALVLEHRRNINKYLVYSGGVQPYIQADRAGGLPGYGRWVADQRPTVVVMTKGAQPPSWLAPTLGKDYWRVMRTPWQTFISRSLGVHTRKVLKHDLHHSLRRARARAH